jgi:hypothetical protein
VLKYADFVCTILVGIWIMNIDEKVWTGWIFILKHCILILTIWVFLDCLPCFRFTLSLFLLFFMLPVTPISSLFHFFLSAFLLFIFVFSFALVFFLLSPAFFSMFLKLSLLYLILITFPHSLNFFLIFCFVFLFLVHSLDYS